MSTLSESAVRKLRAAIYGELPDESWEKVRDKWMKPDNVKWLQEQPQNQNQRTSCDRN